MARRRVVETIVAVSNQAGGAAVDCDCQRFESVVVTVECVGAAGNSLVLAPSGYRDPGYWTLVTGSSPGFAAPAAGSILRVAIGPGMAIPAPVPASLAVALSVPGGAASIRVEGVRYEDLPEVGESGRTFRELVERIERLVALVADRLGPARR